MNNPEGKQKTINIITDDIKVEVDDSILDSIKIEEEELKEIKGEPEIYVKIEDCPDVDRDYEEPVPESVTEAEIDNSPPNGCLEKKYNCSVCSFQTNYLQSMQQHCLVHLNSSEVELYKCDECKYTTRWKRYLYTHKFKHKDPSEIVMYKCAMCPYQSRYKKGLEIHNRKHIKNELLEYTRKDSSAYYKCKECGFFTKYVSSFYRHCILHKTFTDMEIYKCTKCSFVTKYSYNLKKHNRTCISFEDFKRYRCKDCDFETCERYKLRRHYERVHKKTVELEVLNFPCRQCEYNGKSKEDLQQHKVLHKSRYKCEKCEYTTQFRVYLTRHMKKHKDLKEEGEVFICKKCNFKTMRKRNLVRHVKKHESTELKNVKKIN